jgi:hypothetical protein
MRQDVSRTRAVLAALLAGATLLLSSPVAAVAAPVLGADCGTGASMVGADAAGKVTLGYNADTCTITFSVAWPNAPACTATNETNGGGRPAMVGVSTTKTALRMDPKYPWLEGDVISYLCVGY